MHWDEDIKTVFHATGGVLSPHAPSDLDQQLTASIFNVLVVERTDSTSERLDNIGNKVSKFSQASQNFARSHSLVATFWTNVKALMLCMTYLCLCKQWARSRFTCSVMLYCNVTSCILGVGDLPMYSASVINQERHICPVRCGLFLHVADAAPAWEWYHWQLNGLIAHKL